jgi:glycosyltransferase involved in cell wall biosynthesis
MKVLLVSTFDRVGGAAQAAYRLHQGLNVLPPELSVTSQMLVQRKSSHDATVLAPQTRLDRAIARLRSPLDRLPLYRYGQRQGFYSVQWLPDHLPQTVAPLQPDVINLHWTGRGFVQIETLKRLNRPLVWTLHDMWAFTGGCHYSDGCDRYQQQCGACPQLHSARDADLTRWIWQRKATAWRELPVTLVSPSRWLADCARKSALFHGHRIEVIPYGLDLQLYKPIQRSEARQQLGLPQDKPLVLFGALEATSDRRKGFHLLLEVMQRLRLEPSPSLDLVILGSDRPPHPPDFGFPVHYLGHIQDAEAIAMSYAAANVFVAPSLQDNLPNTVLEALACGTPCVAFDIGGMPDMINHRSNGYLARPFDCDDFAAGLRWVLQAGDRLGDNARAQAEQAFSLEQQARHYQQLFTDVIQQHHDRL